MKILSYALFKSDPARFPMYAKGTMINIYTARELYPEFIVDIFHNDTVPETCLDMFRKEGAMPVLIKEQWSHHASGLMMWRFLPLDPLWLKGTPLNGEPNICLFRDLDSRLTVRERWCYDRWLESGELFYTMKDSTSHAGVNLMGGMTGGYSRFAGLGEKMQDWLIKKVGPPVVGYDQEFLSKYLYPMVQDSCKHFGLGGVPIPVKYPDIDSHIGAPDGTHSEEEIVKWKIREIEAICSPLPASQPPSP